LNANLADAHLELEKVYYHIGLTDKVIAAGEQVQRLDPSRALSSNRSFHALIDAGRLGDTGTTATCKQVSGERTPPALGRRTDEHVVFALTILRPDSGT
jgi:hypothetical protein